MSAAQCLGKRVGDALVRYAENGQPHQVARYPARYRLSAIDCVSEFFTNLGRILSTSLISLYGTKFAKDLSDLHQIGGMRS